MDERTEGEQSLPELVRGTDDPILDEMHQAEADYRAFRERWQAEAAELAAARDALARADAAAADLDARLTAVQNQLDLERRKARRERTRANQLGTQVKDIHRALFSGNVYDLILKACLTLSEATRGVYLTMRGPDDTPRVRAAVNMQGYPDLVPSPFIAALAREVIVADKSFVINNRAEFGHLPAPTRESERFRNCIAAEVVLRGNLDGVIIIADKRGDGFDEGDADVLINVGSQAAVAVENARLRQELERAYRATISVLGDAMEAKDPYTHGHCEMVAVYAEQIALRLGLPEEERNIVTYAALLHDIGKIAVADGVLNKPGLLLPEERELVRAHVRIGHDILQSAPTLGQVAVTLLRHHEWYDGSGYPDGLAGEAIPLASRIVSVVDAYCAMTTKRSYRDAITSEQACIELSRCAGTQFDPQVVEHFLAVLAAQVDSDLEDKGVLPGFAHLRYMPPAPTNEREQA